MIIFKRKGIVLLPTQKSNLILSGGVLHLGKAASPTNKEIDHICQEIYITTSEKVTKQDTWVVFNNREVVNIQDYVDTTVGFREQCQKIIATTDVNLIRIRIGTIATNKAFDYEPLYAETGIGLISNVFTTGFVIRYNRGYFDKEILVEYEGSEIKIYKEGTINLTYTDGVVFDADVVKKDSWNRNEVKALLINYSFAMGLNPIGGKPFDDWVEENL